jgi:hypothetical protein
MEHQYGLGRWELGHGLGREQGLGHGQGLGLMACDGSQWAHSQDPWEGKPVSRKEMRA